MQVKIDKIGAEGRQHRGPVPQPRLHEMLVEAGTGYRASGEVAFEADLRRAGSRIVVDGRWTHDLANPVIETNEYGELNSIVEVTR